MAAFTTFSHEALERYLMMFDLASVEAVEAIAGGIENSNYFVTADDRTFVLTICEDLTFDDIPFFNELFSQLSRSGLPVPVPERTLDGMTSTIFCGKPAWLFPRLPGTHPVNATPELCRVIGDALARLHQAPPSRYQRDNPYDLDWTAQTIESERHRLSTEDQALLASVVETGQRLASADLPRGTIHGDLFMDNTLFEGDTLTGIIDFYHACDDFLVQDIAITQNAWCTDADGRLDATLGEAMLDGYTGVRPLGEGETELLPAFRQLGASRFVLTRLLSGGDDGPMKDPEEFLKILRQAS